MHILTLNANLKGIGTYQRCFYFSRELARLGHDVTMITVSREERYRPTVHFKKDWVGETDKPVGDGPWIRFIEAPGLGYKWLPGWGSGPLDIALRTAEALSGRYHAVYGFEYQPNVSWPVYLTKWIRKYRFFSDWCDWHAGVSNRLRGWKLAHRIDAFLEESIRYPAEKVTVISEVLQERAKSLGISEEKVVHLPNGIDTEYIQPQSQRETRIALGLPLDRPTWMTVNDGDMRRVVRLCQRCQKHVPDALAVVVGKVDQSARQLADRLGMSDHVVWAGWVSNEIYPNYLSAADLCFLPLEDTLGNRARFPAKLLDFLAAGRAVVTTDIGIIGPLVNQHHLGMAVKPDEDSWVFALSELLNDRSRRESMGERARHLMTSQWDWRSRTLQLARVIAS